MCPVFRKSKCVKTIVAFFAYPWLCCYFSIRDNILLPVTFYPPCCSLLFLGFVIRFSCGQVRAHAVLEVKQQDFSKVMVDSSSLSVMSGGNIRTSLQQQQRKVTRHVYSGSQVLSAFTFILCVLLRNKCGKRHSVHFSDNYFVFWKLQWIEKVLLLILYRSHENT